MAATGRAIQGAAVRTRDGVLLAGDLHPGPGSRGPTILCRTPYGRELVVERGVDVDPARSREQGFAVVVQDVRGTGGSEGAFRPFADDAADAVDSIAWIASQPWSDGRVVMAGGSYSGLLVLQAAGARPPALRGVAPTMSGAFVPGHQPGGGIALARVAAWLRRLIAEASPSADVSAAALRELEALPALELFHAFLTPDSPAWSASRPIRRWLTGTTDPAWRRIIDLPGAPLPAIHATGYYDLCAATAVQAFEEWRDRGDPRAPQGLTLGPWTHDLTQQPVYPLLGLAGSDATPGAIVLERQLAFLRHVLDPGSVAPPAPVLSFVLGANRWDEGHRWPPAGVRWRALALGATASLGAAGEPGTAAVRYRYDPARPAPSWADPDATLGRTGPADQRRIERRDDVRVFTSDPLDAPIEIAGSPVARLVVGSTAEWTAFVARLTVVRPDGVSVNLCEGSWTGGLSGLPYAPASAGRRCEIRLGPTRIAIGRGWRVRLQVTSSSFPDLYPASNTGHDIAYGPPLRTVVADQTIVAGGPNGSTLVLPVLAEAVPDGWSSAC